MSTLCLNGLSVDRLTVYMSYKGKFDDKYYVGLIVKRRYMYLEQSN